MKSKEYKKFKEELLSPLKKRERELYKVLWQEWKDFFKSCVPEALEHEDKKVIKSATRLALARFVVSICHHDEDKGELCLPSFDHAVELTEAIKLLGSTPEAIELLAEQESSIVLCPDTDEDDAIEPLTLIYEQACAGVCDCSAPASSSSSKRRKLWAKGRLKGRYSRKSTATG